MTTYTTLAASFAEADKNGLAEIRPGVYLQSAENIIADQAGWDDEDEAKDTDFSVGDYWLTTAGEDPIDISDLDELKAEVGEDEDEDDEDEDDEDEDDEDEDDEDEDEDDEDEDDEDEDEDEEEKKIAEFKARMTLDGVRGCVYDELTREEIDYAIVDFSGLLGGEDVNLQFSYGDHDGADLSLTSTSSSDVNKAGLNAIAEYFSVERDEAYVIARSLLIAAGEAIEIALAADDARTAQEDAE